MPGAFIKIDQVDWEQLVETRWSSTNREHYVGLGYPSGPNRSSLVVKVKDLMPNSLCKFAIICGCGQVNFITMAQYVRDVLNKGYYRCSACANRVAYTVEYVRSVFEERGLTPLFTEYVNNKTKLPYLCPHHPEEVRHIKFNQLQQGQGCWLCANKIKSIERMGSKNIFYVDGSQAINDHLRRIVKPWQRQIRHKFGFMCHLTQQKARTDVHHLYPFSSIVREAHSKLGITIKESVDKYTYDEMQALEQLVLDKHMHVPVVLVSKELHNLFHALYSKTNFTSDDYLEFEQNYQSGELNAYTNK